MSRHREELVGARARVDEVRTKETWEARQQLQVTQALETTVRGVDLMPGCSEKLLKDSKQVRDMNNFLFWFWF